MEEVKIIKRFPHPTLRDNIKYLWALNGQYRDQHFERFLPNGHFELLIDFGECPSQTDNQGKWLKRPRMVLAGGYSRHFFIRRQGTLDSIGILFKPGQIQKFLDFPVDELEGELFDLADIFGHDADLLLEELQETECTKRLDLLEGFIGDRFRGGTKSFEAIEEALDEIVQSRGIVTIRNLSANTGVSSRTLRKRFREQVGFSPKVFSRVLRIDHLTREYMLNRPENFTKIGYDFDYYDQAHFIADFKKIVGITPTKYFKEEHPIDSLFD